MWNRAKEGKAIDSANNKPPRYNDASISKEGGDPVPGSGTNKPPKPKKTKGASK